MAEKQDITKWNVAINYLTGNIGSFLGNNVTTEEDLNNLRDIVRLVGSDYLTGLMYAPMPTALVELISDEPGSYHGQYISGSDIAPPPGHTAESYTQYLNDAYNVKAAPNLLDTYLGYTTPKKQNISESQYTSNDTSYPFDPNGPLYDVTDYVAFLGFGGEKEALDALIDDINALKYGEVISAIDSRPGISIKTHRSIDLGNSSNWSIGKTADGKPYLALADEWDFIGAPVEGVGDVMGLLKEHPLNFYGRFSIYNDDFGEKFGEKYEQY